MNGHRPHPVRCAVYTRKSTEDGLLQEFNSLDAQYEACAAYALSQLLEGWTMVSERYDDGGFSGGNLERPALKRLLADVATGKVDIILLYKIDRLTRSVADFAKIVEVLDKAGASFVSITQSFNTTTSMGRLTLNMLLSFAQFEREVTGERIRDKVAASKRKGMWMGGPIPFGYDVADRKLVINKTEAEQVRHIFDRYLTANSIKQMLPELAASRVRSKPRTTRDGRPFGGTPFRHGGIRHILGNRIYLGVVSHKGQVHPGEHEAIINQELWDQVQQRLASAAKRPRTGLINVLSGRIFDADGKRLIGSYGNKGGRKYRYYVNSTRDNRNGWRLPAGDIEQLVQQALARFLADPARLDSELGSTGLTDTATSRATQLAPAVGDVTALSRALELLDARVTIEQHNLRLELDRSHLAEALRIGGLENLLTQPIVINNPVALKRRGIELRLIYTAHDVQPASKDPNLIDLVRRGWAAWNQVATGRRSDNPVERSHLVRLARLRFLAPDITAAILEGRQPVELTARSLLRCSELPIRWEGQRRALGFC